MTLMKVSLKKGIDVVEGLVDKAADERSPAGADQKGHGQL